MKKHYALLLALLCTLSSGAWAQWQWLDNDGRKVFSDRAPPIDIPERNILKQPGGHLPAPTNPAPATEKSPEGTASSTAATPTTAKAPGAGADKELQARKAQAEAAEAAKKKTEEERITKAKTDNCARAQAAKVTFESGKLLRYTNAQGENVFMDEATRNAEQQRIQKIIDSDCKR